MQKVKSRLIPGSFLVVLILMSGACRKDDTPAEFHHYASTPTPESTASFQNLESTTVLVPSATPTVTAEADDSVALMLPTETAVTWFENLPVHAADPDSGYALVTGYPAVLYRSAEDAAIGGVRARTLPGDEIYVSYTNSRNVDGTLVYEIEEGGWMAGSSLQQVHPTDFQGILIEELPENGFGWLVNDAFSYHAESEAFSGREMGHYYRRYVLFVVLEVMTDANGDRWFRIDEDEWFRDQDFSYVSPNIPAEREVAGGRWIDVNLSEQNLTVYENSKPIFATLVSTGKERGWTAAGRFTIYNTTEKHGLLSPDPATVGNYYLEDVPWILFYQGSWALHGAYWHDAFGHPNSHGCVNLSLADAHWLYDWAEAGDWVFLFW